MKLDTESRLHDIRNMPYEERVKHLQTLVKDIEKHLESIAKDLQYESTYSNTLNTLYGQNRLCFIEAIHDELRKFSYRPLNNRLNDRICPCCA